MYINPRSNGLMVQWCRCRCEEVGFSAATQHPPTLHRHRPYQVRKLGQLLSRSPNAQTEEEETSLELGNQGRPYLFAFSSRPNLQALWPRSRRPAVVAARRSSWAAGLTFSSQALPHSKVRHHANFSSFGCFFVLPSWGLRRQESWSLTRLAVVWTGDYQRGITNKRFDVQS